MSATLDGITLEAIGARRPYYFYYGERPEWLIVWTHCPNVASCLDDSNNAAMIAAMREMDASGQDWAIENVGHWVSPLEQLIVRPGSACETAARAMLARHADYPALDEDDWSEREYDAVLAGIADAIHMHLAGRHNALEADYADIASHFYRATDGDWDEEDCYPEFVDRDWTRPADVADNRRALAAALREWRASRRGN